MDSSKLSRRQLVALGFVCVLSSLIRRAPRAGVAIAGAGAVFSAVLAVLPLGLLLFLVLRLEKRLCRGAGLEEALLASLGPVFGRAVLVIYGGWFVLLAGFTLRSGADRLITAVYPEAGNAVFCVFGLLACLPAVLGRIKPLGRAAMIFRIILLLALVPAIAFALPRVDLTGIWMPQTGSLREIMAASLTFVHPLAISAFLVFLAGETEGEPGKGGALGWSLCSSGLSFLICLVCVGTLGAELCAKVHNPFFAVMREVSIFGSVEHVEALVVSAWVLCDFVLVSVLLHMASRLFARVFGAKGRASAWLCCGASLAVSLFCARTSAEFSSFYDSLVPVVNLALSAAALPLIMLLALALKRR